MPWISVIIPVYNAEGSLRELYLRLKNSLILISDDFEVIMVEDCGGDRSWDIIVELSVKDHRVKGVQLSRNFGQHNALLCGIRMAQGEIIVTMDDDLQHPPEEIPKLLNKLQEGWDVVYGTPEKERHGFWRNLASRVIKLGLQASLGVEIASKVSAFRVFRTRGRNAFANYEGPFVSIDVLLGWGTKRFAAVPVRHEQREIGSSNYTFRKLVTHALNMMTGFSTLPLKLASAIGFTFSLFGFVLLGYIVGSYLIRGTVVPGFAFLGSIITIFSGVQLLTIGIIGEYLGRLYFRSMNRPPYIIRDQVISGKQLE